MSSNEYVFFTLQYCVARQKIWPVRDREKIFKNIFFIMTVSNPANYLLCKLVLKNVNWGSRNISFKKNTNYKVFPWLAAWIINKIIISCLQNLKDKLAKNVGHAYLRNLIEKKTNKAQGFKGTLSEQIRTT